MERKFALLSVSGLKDEKLIKKKANLHENGNMQTLYFCQVSSESIFIISSNTVSKLVCFLDTVYFMTVSAGYSAVHINLRTTDVAGEKKN